MRTEKALIRGKTINLRNVGVDDAPFILSLRLDPRLNSHLSSTDPSLAAQRAWIERYRAEPGQQYYFIIEDHSGQPHGTVRVYDLQPQSFCWGSWIVHPQAPRKAAIESALLVYEFGFFELGFAQSHFDVRKQNTRVVDFHRRFGATIERESEQDYFFRFLRSDYERVRPQYLGFLP